jgi:hypothetical protein
MSITATNNNPVLISVDTTATTDARTDNVNPATADTRAWRYNDDISATVLAGASVTDYVLEFETQGGNDLSVVHQGGAASIRRCCRRIRPAPMHCR